MGSEEAGKREGGGRGGGGLAGVGVKRRGTEGCEMTEVKSLLVKWDHVVEGGGTRGKT